MGIKDDIFQIIFFKKYILKNPTIKPFKECASLMNYDK